VEEEEEGEPADMGILFTHAEVPKAPTDALNDEACRRAHGLGAQAVGLNLEVGAAGGAIEFFGEGRNSYLDQSGEIFAPACVFALSEKLASGIIDLATMIMGDRGEESSLRAEMILNSRHVFLVGLSRDLPERDAIKTFSSEELLSSAKDFLPSEGCGRPVYAGGYGCSGRHSAPSTRASSVRRIRYLRKSIS
jgi:hypothetical protein